MGITKIVRMLGAASLVTGVMTVAFPVAAHAWTNTAPTWGASAAPSAAPGTVKAAAACDTTHSDQESTSGAGHEAPPAGGTPKLKKADVCAPCSVGTNNEDHHESPSNHQSNTGATNDGGKSGGTCTPCTVTTKEHDHESPTGSLNEKTGDLHDGGKTTGGRASLAR